MDCPEFELADVFRERSPSRGPARVLLLGPATPDWDSMAALLEGRGHRCTRAGDLADARARIARRPFDLVLLDPDQPDGDGLELLPMLARTAPATKSIVVARALCPATIVRAMRQGAVDYVTAPVDADTFGERIDSALIKSRLDRQRDERLVRLKRICEELNTARRDISRQVDSLCEDLVSAYEDMAEQINEVEMSSEFRTLLGQDLDVEAVLRTLLEYMLGRTGPTNAAVYLPEVGGTYSLGAFVNYDCPRDEMTMLLEHLGDAVCPQMAEESEIVRFEDADQFAEWIGYEAGFLAGTEVLAFSCRHEGEALAVVTLFRRKEAPFDPALGPVLEILRRLFAEHLGRVIRVHHRASAEWPEDAVDDEVDYDDFGFGGIAA
ncbi:MAG: GAF domain-containing protein [Planctomycetota bacterium]|jgi:DNA-binding response OmpR family regulator